MKSIEGHPGSLRSPVATEKGVPIFGRAHRYLWHCCYVTLAVSLVQKRRRLLFPRPEAMIRRFHLRRMNLSIAAPVAPRAPNIMAMLPHDTPNLHI